MTPRQRPRAEDLRGRIDTAVRRIVREPVNEAVREALEEQQTAQEPPDGDGGGRRGRRLIPTVAAVLVAALAVRWWRRSAREPAYGAEAAVEDRAGEYDEGEGIQVEAAGEG